MWTAEMLMLDDDDDDGDGIGHGRRHGRRRNAYHTSNMEIDDGAKIFVQL